MLPDAEAWNRKLEEEEEAPLVLDIRNKYEWDLGHFKGSQRPEFGKFRSGGRKCLEEVR